MVDSRTVTHLQIGVITRPHGVRGELKVRLHYEHSTALWEQSHLVVEFSDGRAERMEVESVRGSNKAPILALSGVDTRNQAESYRDALLWVPRNALPALGPGEYYLVDLIGCLVFHDQKQVGEVLDVRPDPSVDTMVLRLKKGGSAELPIVDAWLDFVDVQSRRVELRSLDGLIESG